MLGNYPNVRSRARASARRLLAVLVGAFAVVASCTEGRLPTQPGGLTPQPIRLSITASVSPAGRAMKIVARYAKKADTTQVVPFDSATVTLTGTETQLPVQLDIAPCLAAADREFPATTQPDGGASECVMRLVVTLLDAGGAVIDRAVLPPIMVRPNEQAQAPAVSLGIIVGKVAVSPKTATINALTRTLDLGTTVYDKSNVVIATPSLSYRSLDSLVASVDSASGRVTARAVGTARVVATSRDVSDTATITVRQVAATVTLSSAVTSFFVGDSVLVTAVTKDSAGVIIPATTAAVTFGSSDTTAAITRPTGWVKGLRAASVVITGTSGIASGTLALTVTNVPVGAVTLTPNPDSVGIGRTSRLTATLTGTNGTTLTGRQVMWSSSDTLIAKVDTSGLVVGTGVGSAVVTATSEGKSGTAQVVVETPLFCPGGRPRADSLLADAIARTPVNGTVLVCDGSFAVDTVTINRPLTLRSEHPGGATLTELDQSAVSVQQGRPALIVAGLTSGLVRIVDLGIQMKGRGITLGGSFDQVEIDSLRFVGVDTISSLALTIGASTVPTAHVAVTNSTFRNFSIGVFIIAATDNSVRWNTFQDFAGGGVIFSGNGTTTTSIGRVEDNTFHNCGSRDCIRGLQIGQWAVIARNHMDIPAGSNKLAAILAQRANNVPGRQPIIIEDNVITGAATGADPLTAAGWTTQAGISIRDSVGVQNVIRGNSMSGVYDGLVIAADVDAHDNVVTSSGDAFNVTLSAANAKVQRNDFTSLSTSFKSSSTGSSYQCNWWGDVNGPAAPPAGTSSGQYTPSASQPIAGQAGVACTPVAPAGVRTWTGATSTDWAVASNWSPANVPTTSDTAVVNAGGNQPVLTANTSAARLVLGTGATLNAGSWALTLESMGLNGAISGNNVYLSKGTSSLAGSAGTIYARSSARLLLTGNASVTQLNLSDTTDVTLNGHRLTTVGMTTTNAATLTLTNAADTLSTGSGTLNVSGANLRGRLTAGTVLVGGDFYAYSPTSTFISTGTKVVATGSGNQTFYVGGDTLTDLVLANSGSTSGVNLAGNGGTLVITGSLVQTSGFTTTYEAHVLGGVTVSGGTLQLNGTLDMVQGTLTTAAGTSVTGNGTLILHDPSGTSQVAGSFTPLYLTVAVPARQAVTLKPSLGYQNVTLKGGSQLTLSAPMTLTQLTANDSTDVTLNGYRLTTGGVLTTNTATLTLTNAADTLSTGVQPLNLGGGSLSGKLSAGTILVGGDFYAYSPVSTFFSTGTTVVATGAGNQTWYVAGDTFADVLIANTDLTGSGVNFGGNGGTTTLTGSLTVQSGTFTNSSTTHVGQNLTFASGTRITNNGDLQYSGTYTNNAASYTGTAPHP